MSAGLLLILPARSALPGDAFVEEIPGEFEGRWREERANDLWHGRSPYIGGLGFEIVLEEWPRLLQRGFLDVVNRHNGNREVFDIAGWLDLGQVRAGGAGSASRLTGASWCSREYACGKGPGALRFTASRLTPAVLFRTGAGALDLFAGEKTTGRGVPRTETRTRAVPAHAAFTAGGKVVIRGTGDSISLSAMSEPWMLFWYGGTSWFYRSRIPNIVWKMKPLREYLQTDYFYPCDLPVLVVFQNKPAAMQPAGDCLRVSFGSRGAGSVVVMPLLGFYHPPSRITETWKDGLPGEIISRCRTWSRRLRALPLGCAESRRPGEQQGEVTIRQSFEYLEIPDAWNTPRERLAPLPPVAALAKRYGFPVRIRGELARETIPTHSGPYGGIPGSDVAELTVSRLDPYLDEVPLRRIPESGDARLLVDELRGEIGKMIEAGRLAPAMSLDRHYVARIDIHFANPAETVLALSEALPYLGEGGRKAAVEYLLEHLRGEDPLQVREVPVFTGKRREYFTPLPPEVYMKNVDPQGRRLGMTSIRHEDRLDGMYALWLLARTTGDWSYLKEHWEAIQGLMDDCLAAREWATCGYFRGPGELRHWPGAGRGEDRGSVAAASGRFPRWVALARVAGRLGDRVWRERAAYLLARTALLRFAQGKLLEYLYGEKFQTIDTGPDWMFRLSTASGNGGGQGLLWTDHWAGPADDVRQVIQWDEFGPLISQMWGDHWQATLPLFQNLTPQCGRFLGDHLKEECGRFIGAVEKNAPAWFITRRPSNLGKETAMDNPRNSYGIFLGKCYVLGAPGSEMLRCQDIPFTRLGDLYHIRRLTANIARLGGMEWQKTGGAVR